MSLRQGATAVLFCLFGIAGACSDSKGVTAPLQPRASIASADDEVNVAIAFYDTIRAGDRAFVALHTTHLPRYEFRGFHGMLVRVPRAVIALLRANSRVRLVEVGIPTVRVGEIRGWQSDALPYGMSIKRVHDETAFGDARFGGNIGVAVIDDLVACYGVSDLLTTNGGSGCAKRVDVTDENDSVTVGNLHGTRVASVIGSGVDNNMGIRGVAPRVLLYSIKVHSAVPPYPTGSCDDVAAAVDYATYDLASQVRVRLRI